MVKQAKTIKLPSALAVGVVGAIVLTLASYSGGATRNRGGILEALNISFFSAGHGRNIGMTLFWVGMFLLIAAWILAGKFIVSASVRCNTRGVEESPATHRFALAARPVPPAEVDESAFATMKKTMWAWILPLLLAAPLSSRDVYSYLMQGAMVRDGFDPYTEGPAVNPGPFLLEVSQDWRNTTTPYGPLHLWIGDGVTRLVGDNVTIGVFVYKLISVLSFAAIAWSIPVIARKLGGDPTLALWLGVANPVMILHLIGGMHNESTMVALVSVGLLTCLHHRYLVGIALIAVAVSLKATAFIAVPFVVWLMMHHFGQRFNKIAAFIVSGAVAVIETVAVVALVTWASGTSSGWLSEITGNSKVINPLAGPTVATDTLAPLITTLNEDITYNQILDVMRTIATVFMLLGLVLMWWLFRANRRAAMLGIPAAYQVAFMFNSVTLPWYFASVVTLLGVARPPLWTIQLSAGASVFVALAFSGDGNHQLYTWWWVLGSLLLACWAVHWMFNTTATPHARVETTQAETAVN
ncbi:alpha-(1-_6)-mannopyranosyltransferase A [Corynebacterium casei]|uniref:alpha-(1->6)-mannopyranosyltransferase A n=1 Tax=Corynebacterium casei TaxID=160386 RepID=UPI003F91DD9A